MYVFCFGGWYCSLRIAIWIAAHLYMLLFLKLMFHDVTAHISYIWNRHRRTNSLLNIGNMEWFASWCHGGFGCADWVTGLLVVCILLDFTLSTFSFMESFPLHFCSSYQLFLVMDGVLVLMAGFCFHIQTPLCLLLFCLPFIQCTQKV